MRKLAAVMLLLPVLLSPVAALADEDEEHVIGPSTVDENAEPVLSEPIDVDEIFITTKTPADEFVNATAPLVLALGVGSLGLVIYTMARNSQAGQKD
jgi:hypothetical protein